MKIVFFGLGSIGMRHAQILRASFGHELAALRSTPGRAGNALSIRELASWDAVADFAPDVAVITNPTSLHVPTATRAAALGAHLFIEKPLSDTLAGIDALAALCARTGRTCYTAYCMRFHPVITAMRARCAGRRILHVRVACTSYLPAWRPGRDAKAIYSARADLGGGVFLDLAHEFDYLAYLFGDLTVRDAQAARMSDVTVDVEDAADILLRAARAPLVNLHLNFLSPIVERRMVVNLDGGAYLIGDLVAGTLTDGTSDGSTVAQFSTDRNAYLKAQWDYFFANLGNPAIMNNLAETTELLRTILACKERARIDGGVVHATMC